MDGGDGEAYGGSWQHCESGQMIAQRLERLIWEIETLVDTSCYAYIIVCACGWSGVVGAILVVLTCEVGGLSWHTQDTNQRHQSDYVGESPFLFAAHRLSTFFDVNITGIGYCFFTDGPLYGFGSILTCITG